MSPVDLEDIQGNILHGYTLEHAAYLFAGVKDPVAGRRWLTELLPQVTTAPRGRDDKPQRTLNVALTYEGLRALEVDEAALAGLPEDFCQGMAHRAKDIGDTGDSAPADWERGLGTGEAHVLITLYEGSGPARDRALADLDRRVRRDAGLSVVFTQCARGWEDAREHFGFADGFSQPAVAGSGRTPKRAGVKRRFLGGWRHLRLGEFVLGHRDEDGVVAGGDAALLRNGTFMVWRKLEQDVALFRRWLRGLGGEDPDEQKRVAAKIVGRWPEGGSLIRSPGMPTAAGRGAGFSYRRDLDGLRCPVGAHVRRANPRDAMGWRTERTKRHRLIRRGMPYGPRLAEGALSDDGQKRGLIFVCLNASIVRQFELVQAHWLLEGDAFGLGDDKDLLLAPADARGRMTVPGHPPRFLSPQEQLVTTRGGEYLLVPGLSALRTLARG